MPHSFFQTWRRRTLKHLQLLCLKTWPRLLYRTAIKTWTNRGIFCKPSPHQEEHVLCLPFTGHSLSLFITVRTLIPRHTEYSVRVRDNGLMVQSFTYIDAAGLHVAIDVVACETFYLKEVHPPCSNLWKWWTVFRFFYIIVKKVIQWQKIFC